MDGIKSIFVCIHALATSLHHKIIHIYTDNELVKFMLIKMRAKLARPDLQILINTIYKLSINYQFNLIIGSDNVTADKLSRFEHIPKPSFSLSHFIKPIPFLLKAIDLVEPFSISIKHLVLI